MNLPFFSFTVRVTSFSNSSLVIMSGAKQLSFRCQMWWRSSGAALVVALGVTLVGTDVLKLPLRPKSLCVIGGIPTLSSIQELI